MNHILQSAIFAEEELQYHYYHLEFRLKANANKQSLLDALSKLPSGSVSSLVAFSKKALKLLDMPVPSQLISFPDYKGVNQLSMPSTQADILIWIKSSNHSELVDSMLELHKGLSNVCELCLEVNGLNYHNSRDMIGFVDGTGNPKTNDLRYQATVIPESEIGAGGSYVMSQKWVTDLDSFNARPVKEQEQIIGRTKVDDIELEGDEQPNNSHVSRTDIKVDGVAQKIWRSSSPFASAQEQGLYFLAFSCELSRFESQIHSMLGLTDDGVSDHLMQYSTPISGSYWYAPSQTTLDELLK